MTIRLLTCSAIVGAFALCSCATSPPPKSLVAADCVGQSAGSYAPSNSLCATPGVRSYSQTDLQRTGKVSAGDALSMLDPAVTVKH
jgi:hypothetical protein